ncbi:terminase large subunit [Xylophilus rhododendri]|uniref:Terminase large subunit n=1 Tax=Xylophilus rhododendri TaxID=2697032 RepID=A0A857J9C5_9BURK|nr:terminase TerL endonuclease subunit [Xylophilus rhododendri]QHI99355.1 terminase large subunit [Xylophilus rhododendri]
MTTSPFVTRAVAYARQVTEGEVAAGKFERLACKRFLRDMDRQGSDGFPYLFDDAAGARACVFIELLPHIKGQWAKPEYINGRLQHGRLRLENWQVFIVVQLFGWKHRVSGLRRFRRVYLEVARKNAKSTLAAGIALYLLVADNEPGAHVYSAATTGDQAREVFDVARNMALRLPEFQARFGVDIGKHDITVPETASSFKPLNAEGSTLDGLNIHGAIVDELHAHKTRAVYDVLDSATGARSQPMIVMITTAGSDRSGICYEQRDYTCKALEGVLPQGEGLGTDDTWFGVIFTIDDGDNWQDPAVWRKSNPNLGVSVQVDDLQSAIRKAQAQPSALGNVLTKRLNVWVNADSAWMDMQAWDRCGDRKRVASAARRLPMIGSLDLASKIDVAAKVALYYDQAEDLYFLRPMFWLPSRAVEQGFNSQYEGWRRAGHLQVTDGETIDFDVIEDAIRADVCTEEVLEYAYDPHQATQLVGHMLAEEVPMVEYRPTVLNFSEPMKTFEALVLSGKIVHDENPVMTWMVSNVVCHRDHKDNIYPRKEREQNKIDGPVAAIAALGRWLAQEVSPATGFWETFEET